MQNSDELIKQGLKNLYEIQQINRQRCQSIEFAMNENAAVIFLGIGIHYDKRAGKAFPVITGSDWISREDALQLLQEAMTAMNTKLIEDVENKS